VVLVLELLEVLLVLELVEVLLELLEVLALLEVVLVLELLEVLLVLELLEVLEVLLGLLGVLALLEVVLVLELLEVLLVLELLEVLEVLLGLLEVLALLEVVLVLEVLLEVLALLEVVLVLDVLEVLLGLLEVLALLEVVLVLELLEVLLGLETLGLRVPPASPLPGPSPYSGPTRGLTERREPQSRPMSPVSLSASPVRTVRAGRILRPRPPPVPGTHFMTLHPSTAPQRVPLPSPPASSLPDGPDPESDSLRAASPTVTRFLATAVTDPLFESTAASALSASVCPPSVRGECALGTDVLVDRQEDLECFAAASPHLVSMLLAPEGDPNALDIRTPRSYAEAIEGPYTSQWQVAMDAEMASWKSTGTYVDEVPPPGANI
ncbi:unnamed protein product, partial [Closterium sp. NIES-54]